MNWIYILYVVMLLVGIIIGMTIRGNMMQRQQNKDQERMVDHNHAEKYKMYIPKEHISDFWDLFDRYNSSKKSFKYKSKYILWKKIEEWIPELIYIENTTIYKQCTTPYIYSFLTKDEIACLKAKKLSPLSSPFSKTIAEIMKKKL